MSNAEQSSPDELAKVERLAREVVLRKGDWTISPDELGALLAEFDRLRLVEQAATTLVDDYERRLQVTINGKVQVDKRAIDALATAVHGVGDR